MMHEYLRSVPVCLCGKGAYSFGCTGACKQTSSSQVTAFTTIPSLQELLDGQWLNHRMTETQLKLRTDLTAHLQLH